MLIVLLLLSECWLGRFAASAKKAQQGAVQANLGHPQRHSRELFKLCASDKKNQHVCVHNLDM